MRVVSLPAPATDPCPRIVGCAYLAAQPIPTLNQATAADASKVSSLTVPSGQSYAEVYNCCSGTPTTLGPGLYYIYGGISGTLQGDGVTLVNSVWHWFGQSANWHGDDGIPHRLVEHLGYSGLALLVAALIALPLGLLTKRTSRSRRTAWGKPCRTNRSATACRVVSA